MSKESFLLSKDLHNGPGFRKYLTPAVLVGLILLLGIGLRFYDLGAESYWIDEMSTVIEAKQSIHQLITSGRLDQPPAYYLPFHLWVQIFGTAEVSTRSFSALIGIGSVVLIYLVGRELFGKSVGLLSAFLMAISGFQIYYSQIARFYSFFEFTALLSFLFFILALRSKRILHFALYGAASILMVYSHPFGVFILAAQDLFFILQGKKYRNVITPWLICQALVLLAYVPYFYPLIFGESSVKEAINFQMGGRSAPGLWDPLHSVYRFILPARRVYGQEIILTSYAAAGSLLVAGTWIYAIRQGKINLVSTARGWDANLQEVPDVTSKLLLVSCWLVCPILLPFIISKTIIPIYKDYYTISAAPAVYLLLALGIFNARKVVPVMISLGVLVILIAPSLGHYYLTDMNEQWKEAAMYVEKNSGPNEVIVFAPNENIGIQQRAFNWYYQGTLQGCGLGVNLPDPAVWKALMQCISGHEHFWVIIRGTSEDTPHNRYTSFFLNPDQTAMHLIQEHHFVGIAVYLFELTKR
jgi:uncharacterized membrane protein